jgi:ArsR family transcriptional regulator, lead/cadmium/zinc/bismuth-responsive transcriptional repressor
MYVDTSIHDLDLPGDDLARFFKALSEPARLRIILALSDECRPVSDVVTLTGLPQPLVSHHLRILRETGIARPQRRGSFVYY